MEDFLVDFNGCVLIVSHDRYFLDKIITQVFAFQGDGTMKDFPGNYTEYRNWQDEQEELKREQAKQPAKKIEEKPVAKVETPVAATTPKQTKKLSYKEQREVEELEKEIAELETSKNTISEELSSGTLDHKDLLDKGFQLQKIEESLETKSMRWLELQEMMEG